MPDLIIVRLHPVNPTSGSTFTSYLTNLSISAFDLSFADIKTGVAIGTANVAWAPPSTNPGDPGLADTSGLVPTPNIFQHYSIVLDPITLAFVVEVEAVATAIIQVNPPAGHPEYQRSDLRLEITNNTRKIADENLDFNVEIVNIPLSNNPATYMVQKAAVFVGIPDPVLGLDPTVAFVPMPSNGQPPLFDDVVSAINLVLAGDPAGGATLANQVTPFTAAQGLQVAREIVWNRKLAPAPDPPRSLEEMYTRPPTNTGLDTNKADMDRKQFEASLTGFYAIQEATAQRLAKYVFAASAAVDANKKSGSATRVGFTFPVDPATIAAGANVKHAQVALINAGGFVLNFGVPAAYFYALGAGLSSNVSSAQRYSMATLQGEQQTVIQLQQALDDGVIKTPLPISVANAARRMVALGSADSTALAQTPLDADINTLLTNPAGWLAFMGSDVDVSFWQPNPFPVGHLNLVLSAVTEQFAPLIAAIKAIPVNNFAQLQARTTADWTNFFLPGNTALLPPFTAPGTPSERVAAFIRQLRKFFDVANQAGPLTPVTPGAIPTLDITTDDPIQDFIAKYNAITAPPFAFGSPINAAAFNLAVQQVFPGDPEAQARLAQALTTIDELFQTTAGVPPPSMQFSYMEALYARGFTSKASITALSPADFQQALTGTVAYSVAIQIHTNAGNGTGPIKVGPGAFKPVNPDGSLVNCVPPWHLSPLGPVEYLHEMLLASAASTCDTPNPAGNNPPTIGTLITPRRGPLGSLHATAANVHTPVPLIDIVNENLEALVDGSAAGVVYDTNGSQLAGHALKPAGPETPKHHHPHPYQHDPATIFAAIPEHSSPAAPVERPGAYAKLKSDFTAPALPYSQPLDIIRSYLHKLGTSRFQTMRTFRENITEFVLNPALEPADFQKNLWRYPVRIDIAREYLGISAEEYDLLYTQDIVTVPTPGRLLLRELYGFNADNIDGKPWTDIVVHVPEFLTRTGLTYCDFLELQKSEFVTFERFGKDPVFPDCEPCCAIDLVIQFVNPADPIQALKELAVFIALWRTLRHVHNARYSFTELRDICDVLHLFNGANINPDFIRQLAAFQMLRDDLRLSLGEKHGNPAGTGADRMPLLALWVGPAATYWAWAVDYLLGRIEDYAEAHHAREHGHGCPGHRSPEFMKVIAENLDALSSLAGFDPATADTWFARPASTLRFAEVLTKIYLSDFTTGEILYLFTPNTHLDSDDPFPEQDPNEALDSPLNIPEADHPFGLWALRRKLLSVELSEQDEHRWTWYRIVRSLEDEFGYVAPAGADPLESLGQHFFPDILNAYGTHRQYRTGLDPTKPGLWNVAPYGPFRYDTAHKELFTQLPLKDEEVLEKLNHIEQLTAAEQTAVQELYFAPRADLAPFAFLFANFTQAEHRLIEEESEAKRWAYFRHAFALFYARCHVVANHLAEHVSASTDRQYTDPHLAWALLRRLLADENRPNPAAPWEKDTGEPPAATLWTIPNGGAFAALTGLTGTGLLGTFQANKVLVWEEVRGPMSAFGHARNEKNAPFPTILPAMNFSLPGAQLKFAILRNGMATRDDNGEALGGAEAFIAAWRGVLLVEQPGMYRFFAGAPTESGAEPDAEIAERDRWRVSIERGQKTWLLMNHHFPGEKAPSSHSEPLYLRRGAYFLTIEFQENQPVFDKEEHACPRRTGFQVKYQGSDTAEVIEALPIERLYRDIKTAPLEIPGYKTQPVANFLAQHYTTSLRDIRRTYQRAFKGLLFAHRLDLSAKLFLRHSQSEIGFMLDHPDRFEGTSYFPSGGGFVSHHAYLDCNFLPISDPYKPPAKAADDRVDPSLKRQQAMFDWFERLCDYTVMRRDVRVRRERIVWLLFVEAESQQPPDPTALLLHLGVDLTHGSLLLEFYQGKTIAWSDLVDDRWTVREWHADRAVRKLLENFVPADVTQARPDLWASSDDASLALATANITKFYQDGCIENGDPSRYEDIKRLNDGLRERARTALLAYLCGMDRIAVPWGGFATDPKDLSALLLLDVQAGICEKASRIEEAISAVQAFVERARLGLEPTLAISEAFVFAWDRVFASFRVWQACKRRQIYKENWVEYLELEQAHKTEAYRFLESELRRATLTAPVPGGMEHWPGEQLPWHRSLTELQKREPSYIKQIPQPENLGLMGTPDRDGRPSWLAPSQQQTTILPPPNPDNPDTAVGTLLPAAPAPGIGTPLSSANGLPLWIQAAIRLGTRFLRIAAAGEPLASGEFKPHVAAEAVCCKDCCKVHPPVMDEYYFWLIDSEYYVEQTQDADWGKTGADQTSAWEQPDKLPGLLAWTSKPMVRLAWCRVHNGEFQPPRKSDGGAHVIPGGNPELIFEGRTGDSLTFSITAADALPQGYADPSPWGFRYDMATDSAVVLPEVLVPPALPTFPGGLEAYPFFAYFEPGAPLEPSIFNPALAVASFLRIHCRYEAALKWYELYNKPLEDDNRWARCRDRRPPPSDQPPPTGTPPGAVPQSYEYSGAPAVLAWLKQWLGQPGALPAEGGTPALDNEGPPVSVIVVEPGDPANPCCQTEIVKDLLVHQRAVLLLYLETLLQFGDAALCCCTNSPEGFQKARLIFDTMVRILGPRPATIFSQDDGKNPQTIDAFKPRFAPLNPRLMELYESVEERLSLIHYCMNKRRLRSGTLHKDMSYFGDDPVRRGWRTTESLCESEDDCCCPRSPYRFLYLIQKAEEITNDVRTFGGELLAAFEKGDAEYLAALRAGHERQLLTLNEDIRTNEWRDADWQVQALKKAKESAQAKRQYYAALIAAGLIANEQSYVNLTGVSMGMRAAGNIVEAVAEVMYLIPDPTVGAAGIAGTPVSIFALPLGTKLAHSFSAAGKILLTVADITGTSASLSLTEASWDRRLQDWQQQVTVLDIDIEQIERQILGAERRRDSALKQLNMLEQQIEQAREVQDFLRDKFTSQTLYLFLQQELAAMHRQMYELAWCAARQAQRAFNLERGHTTCNFLPRNGWDNLHEGLLSGERLQVSLRTMEKSYLDQNLREYEITKHISLRLHFPLEFLRLKASGSCEIEIPEWMFDMDYPGQYMRRIKNVSVTIPCVVGPYTGVHCRLTLLSSKTRIDPALLEVKRCCHDDQRCCPDCKPGNGYREVISDPRIVHQNAACEAVATSSGQNDTGMFELNFRDERYLPFEYAGAVSRWRIELPPGTNQFDLESVSDWVMHLNYMAREGGDVLRAAACEAAECCLPGRGLRFFDVQQDFAEAWQQLQGMIELCRYRPLLRLRLGQNMFPFLTGRRRVHVCRIELFFEAECPLPGRSHEVEFLPAHHTRHPLEEQCECEIKEFTCIASAEYPCLFHGVLDVKFDPLDCYGYSDLGVFRFGRHIGEIRRAFLVCHYWATEPEGCQRELIACRV